MTIAGALALFVVMLPLAAMPSASVALVVARSVSGGRRSGALSALGIVVGDLVFVLGALAGMSILAGWLGALFSVVRYLGGAYLIWLGWRLLRARPIVAAGQGGAEEPSTPGFADFAAGLLLTLGDLKAIVFYASLFPALVDVQQIRWPDVALIAIITAVTVGGIKLGYVLFSSRIVDTLRAGLVSNAPRRLGGALLIGCGAGLIVKG